MAKEQPHDYKDGGVLAGKIWQPRDLATFAYKHGWNEAHNLTRTVAICLAESQGYERAYNDNKDASGNVVSRDVGILQINIPASSIGTKVEENLYDPDNNFAAARKLYDARGFQPWIAFTSGIALDPEAAGRYIQRACRGVGNFLAVEFQIPYPPLLFYVGGSKYPK